MEPLVSSPFITRFYHGFDMPSGAAQGFSEFLYMCIHGSVVAFEVHAPDRIQNLIPGQDDTLMVQEVQEKVVLLRGQNGFTAVYGYVSSGWFDGDLICGYLSVFHHQTVVSVYESIYLCQKNFGGKRFCDLSGIINNKNLVHVEVRMYQNYIYKYYKMKYN